MTKQELEQIFRGKRVFLTGHTGFKGAWLLQILHWLGADVKGYSLPPEHEHDLYHRIGGDAYCYASVEGDLRDLHRLKGELIRFEPHFVFHLAAQSLVRRSYEYPVDTFSVNAIGTAHVLEAMRGLSGPCAGLMITTDKVYENPERGEPFREGDPLGGYDPYSASKAAAEIVISSYIRSFFNPAQAAVHRKSVASVRAGNVIGGGDYAEDRIIPDIVRALDRGSSVTLRNPAAIRPWQHVLEPLGAYLMLAAKMATDPVGYVGAYNVGPRPEDEKTVEDLTRIFLEAYGRDGVYQVVQDTSVRHEANLLHLDSRKAEETLGWKPRMNATQAIAWTAAWYADRTTGAHEKCMNQIRSYFESPAAEETKG